MIMLANKKSEKQVASDLNLFLGEKSSLQFSSWLFKYIDNFKVNGK